MGRQSYDTYHCDIKSDLIEKIGVVVRLNGSSVKLPSKVDGGGGGVSTSIMELSNVCARIPPPPLLHGVLFFAGLYLQLSPIRWKKHCVAWK